MHELYLLKTKLNKETFFSGRPSGEKIKNCYDNVIKINDSQNKIFKVIADQGANV
jgi:hypothetical protein